jgi:hypothetical protein
VPSDGQDGLLAGLRLGQLGNGVVSEVMETQSAIEL